MKKVLSFVVMLIISMTMMAQSVRIDLSQAPIQASKDKVEWKVENLTFTVTRGKSSHAVNEQVNENGLVMNKDQVVSLSATGGTTISRVTFYDSPLEAGPTAPEFMSLQNCTAELGFGTTVLIAKTKDCTFLGGTLTAYSHIVSIDVETGNGDNGNGGDNGGGDNGGGDNGNGDNGGGDNGNGGDGDGNQNTTGSETTDYGTPMAPITPDLSKYTHKMMVLGAPWGIQDLCQAILRDSKGRLVQKMTMRLDLDELNMHIVDSVRTYTYEDNKMIEDMVLPSYDADDVLHMEPLGRKVTSYYKIDNGHREVTESGWINGDGDGYNINSRVIDDFDNEGRRVAHKVYSVWNNEASLSTDLTYTYDDDDETHGCMTRGLNDYDSRYVSYDCYDNNGNLMQHYDSNSGYLYYYVFDSRNHYLGYRIYKGFDIETMEATSVDDSHRYAADEFYEDESVKKCHNLDGEVRTFTREGNVETETVKNSAGTVTATYTRTFDEQGRIVGKKKSDNTFDAAFIYSDIDADKVLDGTDIVNENGARIFGDIINWKSEKAVYGVACKGMKYGFEEAFLTTYNIVPISILPAETTSTGIAITVTNAGDQLSFDSNGEIYLVDKGGKKRFKVSFRDITVSSEGGKIFVEGGWTSVISSLFSNGRGKAPEAEQIDLSTNEYDLYIPNGVISINNKPVEELYIPIGEEDNVADGVIDIKAPVNDGRIYNLQGMPVKAPAKGQIVIINGKKVIR